MAHLRLLSLALIVTSGIALPLQAKDDLAAAHAFEATSSAVATDDECSAARDGDASSCAVNALQLRQHKTSTESQEVASAHAAAEEGGSGADAAGAAPAETAAVARAGAGAMQAAGNATVATAGSAEAEQTLRVQAGAGAGQVPEVETGGTSDRSYICSWFPWLCEDGGGGASCASYGCGSYNHHHSCQCNSKCAKYGSCCSDYEPTCTGGGGGGGGGGSVPPPAPGSGAVMTLYHQTGPGAGPLILRDGFRPGTQGWCGGGIYFATNPQATETKAIGPNSKKGFMIEARVNVGRILQLGRHCDGAGGMSGARLRAKGYDSVRFNPGDGDEYVVYNAGQILSTRQIPWR